MAEFGIGTSGFAMGGSTIYFGEALPVPPRQGCDVDVIFERGSHEVFREQVKKAIDNREKGAFLRLGLKLIGTTRLTINFQDR